MKVTGGKYGQRFLCLKAKVIATAGRQSGECGVGQPGLTAQLQLLSLCGHAPVTRGPSRSGFSSRLRAGNCTRFPGLLEGMRETNHRARQSESSVSDAQHLCSFCHSCCRHSCRESHRTRGVPAVFSRAPPEQPLQGPDPGVVTPRLVFFQKLANFFWKGPDSECFRLGKS